MTTVLRFTKDLVTLMEKQPSLSNMPILFQGPNDCVKRYKVELVTDEKGIPTGVKIIGVE